MEHTFVLHQNRLVSIGSDAVVETASSAASSPMTGSIPSPPIMKASQSRKKRPHPSSERSRSYPEVSVPIQNNPSYYNRPKSVRHRHCQRQIMPTPQSITQPNFQPALPTHLPNSLSPVSPQDYMMSSPMSMQSVSSFDMMTPVTPYYSQFGISPVMCHTPQSAASSFVMPIWPPVDYHGMMVQQLETSPQTKKRRRCNISGNVDGQSQPEAISVSSDWNPAMVSSCYEPLDIVSPTPQDPTWVPPTQQWQQQWAPY